MERGKGVRSQIGNFDREGVWSDTIFADEAIRFIKADASTGSTQGSENPFFIYLPFQAPHSPFQDPNVLLDPPGKKERKTLRHTSKAANQDSETSRLANSISDNRHNIALPLILKSVANQWQS